VTKQDFIDWALKELHDPSTQDSIRKAAHWLSERGLTWAEDEIVKVLESLNKKETK